MATLTRKQHAVQELTQFAQTLKENGFTVLVSELYPFEWLHFFKNGKFGTVGPDGFFAFNFGTVHKPCRECGTGFQVADHAELTTEHAEKSLSVPGWALNDLKYVRPYTTVEEFINSTNNQWAKYYVL